ncbi:hypothetical protein F442_02832, partial [Phytophthora nicotianae P10297]
MTGSGRRYLGCTQLNPALIFSTSFIRQVLIEMT